MICGKISYPFLKLDLARLHKLRQLTKMVMNCIRLPMRLKKSTSQTTIGHFKKFTVAKRILVNLVKSHFTYQAGQEFNVSLFKEGDFVTVSGTSKGRLFWNSEKYSFSQEKNHAGVILIDMSGLLVLHHILQEVCGKNAGRYGNKKVSLKSLE